MFRQFQPTTSRMVPTEPSPRNKLVNVFRGRIQIVIKTVLFDIDKPDICPYCHMDVSMYEHLGSCMTQG